MSTLRAVELGVLGPLQVRQDGAPVAIPGAKPRAILTMLGLHGGSVVAADALVELLWGEDPPRTAVKALQTHISSLRRALGDGFVLTEGTGWTLAESEVDASRYKSAARLGRDAAAVGDTGQAVACFEEARALWRGIPELPDGRRGTSEKTRWVEGHAALVEDRADALLATGRAAEIIGELEAAVADAPLRERRWGQLMLALYRAGRQGEALGAYRRAGALLADELGIDPGPELRRLETAIVAQDAALEVAVAHSLPSVMRAVTFLLTDIEGSTAAWEAEADAMALALARHDELVEQVVMSRGGRLIKTRGEGDATFSVFERPSAAAAAAIELQDAIVHEPWTLREPIRIRVALHTGEVELRDGDYFGRAVNRAARLRSLAAGGQILCSGATAELVIDSLPDDVALADLGMRQLKNLARPEHVFELHLETAQDSAQPPTGDPPMERPDLPSVLIGSGPFVGRGSELERLLSAWQTSLGGGACAALIAGEPGVGKTRLAGEWSRQAYEQGAVVLYGRCDEDLGAPYQPFAEALRSLVPCVGGSRLRGLRGVEALLPLVPGLVDDVPDLAAPTRADPDTERYALFDAVVALLELASAEAPVVLVLDDLHWAAKPTLLLLRHVLRFGDRARVQIVGTYRSTDLDRSHPLAAMLADLHRDGTAHRISLSGLDEDDVSAYVAKAGYDDEELGPALASVTGGNPFFLIEALRHVDESGGVWDPSTLPQGVREAVSRRLSRLPIETNKALAAAAVVGSRFALDLVERVVGDDLVDAFDEASKAGIVIEEPGGRYRFNHAIVRQSLLAELPSMRRMRLHQRIATTLEDEPGATDELLAELAHHYFECAWAGNAAKAVEYCRRAADQAMARLAYEGAADLYDHALHALDELDDDLPDRDDQIADLLLARCEALLAAGEVTSAASAVVQLQQATVDSARLSAWATCFDGQLSVLVHPERLDDVEAALSAAARKLAEIDDAAGEAKAHTVRATCLARLGRIGDCEIALDDALTAARRAREHRRVNAVLAGAPLAALWGPNPVPRAGGRCLDVVRLLRITTDSPAVEATSTRCQAVLEAFRGRDAAARRMIDSARRTVTELGLRHALLEVEQFAGIVELVLDDPAAAEPHLRQAYNGFRRMGLDADTAETAALLGRACLALNREVEADELCTESERLAGHALKPAIAWRTVRAQLLSRGNDHDEARRVAQAAITVAERTDALVDHGDACLALAIVLSAAGDVLGARDAAQRAVDLYERKGAGALADKARSILDRREIPSPPVPPELPPVTEFDTACARTGERVVAAFNRGAWDEYERLFAPEASLESRRKIVGFAQNDIPFDDWQRQNRRLLETGEMRVNYVFIAVRGERLALARLQAGTDDASPGAPIDEFLQVYGIDEEGRVALQIWFDAEDIDAAMAELDAVHARFQEEHPQARRLENAASQAIERYLAHFASRDWDAIAQVMAHDIHADDRRRVVNAGSRYGRAAEIANLQGVADAGITYMTFVVIAARGERLMLARASGHDRGSEEFLIDVLAVVEANSHNQLAAIVVFDPDDFDDAITELDARYLAGEAATHARTWSVITAGHATVNRRELPPMTPDCVSIDHRRGTSFAPGELTGYFRAGFELDQDVRTYVEAVHRLSDLGAVCTHAGQGVSREGFDAEWRGVDLLTVEGDMVSHTEFFDEADLDVAIARFEELSQPVQRLANTAARVFERVLSYLAARDWDAVAEAVADSYSGIDHRRVVNAENQHGRDAVVNDVRVAADIGFTLSMVSAIAIRGERLVLARVRVSGRDPETIQNDALNVVEIDADEKIAAVVVFDLDDFDAALEELDARYLAGEAVAHARTWSVITGAFAALNQRELPATTPDWVNIDHRRGPSIAPGEMASLLDAAWNVTSDLGNFIEVVHRLDNFGAVISHVANETSQEGFHAEWRVISLLTLDSEVVNRCEVFDEADLDAAIARFDELGRPATRLENTATRLFERLYSHVAAGEWDAVVQITAANVSVDDRRRVVNAGILHGRDANIKDAQATVGVGFMMTMSGVVATRGGRLALTGIRVSGHDPEAIQNDALQIVEIDAEERIAGVVVFDLEDINAAIAELDARYLAGEAAVHARAWSAVTGCYAALNRRETPATTTNFVNIDHRRVTPFAPGDVKAYTRAAWSQIPDISFRVETVHQLSDFGAVITQALCGTSQEGFDAEWREIHLMMLEGDLFYRSEFFDEADLGAAIARFDQISQPATRLENTASQVYERMWEHFRTQDWVALTALVASDELIDDRRRVVNGGVRHGRNAGIEELQAAADIGFTITMVDIKATRGDRLALTLVRASVGDPGAIQNDVLQIVEIDADERIAAVFTFDLEDLDAAIAELDARYLAGEAAAYAHTWSVIAESYAAVNRQEFPALSPDSVLVDHRRAAAFGASDLSAYLRAGLDLGLNIRPYVEAVHRLSDLGAVCSYAAHGVSHEGFDAEWQGIDLVTVDGDMIGRHEFFDDADLDTALARFAELHPQTRWLANAATQAAERLRTCFAARDWDGLAEIMAEDIVADDRRRIVGTGIRRGRQANVSDIRVGAEIGTEDITSSVIATRGYRLSLDRACFCASGGKAAGLNTELLRLVEVDTRNQMTWCLMFDVDDLDAAFEELDARYIAGEAAACSHMWSAMTDAFAAINRHEVPATTPDYIIIDHQLQHATIEASGLTEYLRASWDLTPHLRMYIEAVHRLSDVGAVITLAVHGISKEGFDADWRIVELLTIDGDVGNRCEIFDEGGLDAALAKFEELSRPTRQLENTASRVDKRFQACFAARDWDVMAEMLSDGFSIEDRRRVVNMGNSHGRDAELTVHAYAAVGTQNVKSTVIATRAQRLALNHYQFSGGDQRPDAFRIEMLAVVEIDTDERMAAVVVLDTDDIDAAIAELDARYLAGEAAAYGRTWSAISGSYAAINRHELPLTTPDCVNIDRRRETAMGVGDLIAYIGAGPDRDQDNKAYVEAVHRLTDPGAVVTYAAYETSQEGFDAEWRGIAVLTVEGDMVSRTEVFDEADLDAALARFDELQPQTPRLENTASQVTERFAVRLRARDWDAMAELLADDFCSDDRRGVVGAGIQHGRDAHMADMRTIVDLWITNVSSTIIGTRGERLVLMRTHFSGSDQGPGAFLTEVFGLVEIDTEERIIAIVSFDLDDVDAAFEELDARYVAGEAAAHAHTWSVITRSNTAANRHETLPTTPDCVTIDHRLRTTLNTEGLAAYLRASWDLTPDLHVFIESVHRLSDLGAVVTQASRGTSHEDFEAEWRQVTLFTVAGDLGNRCEIYDEANLDTALAHFDELDQPAPHLGNAASQAYQRIWGYFAARDWEAIAKMVADNFASDDRRRGVNAGIRHGRGADIEDLQAAADIGFTIRMVGVIATRGDRLALTRVRASGRDPETIQGDAPNIVEIDANGRIADVIVFDLEDIDAALEELDARYLAGEAAAHAHTWSVVAEAYAAFNRHELPAQTWVTIDRRRATPFESSTMTDTLRAVWDLTPDLNIRIEAVHQLGSSGAVICHAGHATSDEGFYAEWRAIDFLTVEGDRITGCEIFDEADLDAALARFKEMCPRPTRLENAATEVDQRYWTHFAAREWAAMAELVADDISTNDRRRVVNAGIRHGRDEHMADMRAIAEVLPDWDITSAVMATRGARLVLTRICILSRGTDVSEVIAEVLRIDEIDADNRIVSGIAFDVDDIDAAFAELDSRYLAGEALAHPHSWSAITEACAALSRKEMPRTAPNFVDIDHRQLAAIAPGDLITYLRAGLEDMVDIVFYVEAVHRLTALGAVVTHTAKGTSLKGFDAEWRMIDVFTVEGDSISRLELFDEADLDTALTRFDELHPQTPRLENAATRADDRFFAYFAARNWAALAEILTDESFINDRRPVINAGLWDGRDAVIANLQALADAAANVTSVIATRGERLALTRIRSSNRDPRQGDFDVEMLNIVEIDADEGIVAHVAFDPSDNDAAFEELEARYLAGEAAPYAHTWSVIARFNDAFNRQEIPATDWVTIDHRRLITADTNDLPALIRDVWGLTPDLNIQIESVHRLSSLGAVMTRELHGTSQEGFAAEWRMIQLLTVEGDRIDRSEIFDETDIDAALACFDELHSQKRRLENAATQVDQRFMSYFAARDWDTMAEILSDDISAEDRRRVVNAGVRHGRDAEITSQRAIADVGVTHFTSTVIAIRGRRLALGYYSVFDGWGGSTVLSVTEVNAENQIVARVAFDSDDLDAAFTELDARYLAGEAAAHAHTWSVITEAYAAVNRREIPPSTPEWVNIDHRAGQRMESDDLGAYAQATWDVKPYCRVYVETVHRLSAIGAVVTYAAHGTSQEGFDAEWRAVSMSMVSGDLVDRSEIFDETDLDAALARFDELDRQTSEFENAATRTWERLVEVYNRRDREAFLALTTQDGRSEDRRKGLLHIAVGLEWQKTMRSWLHAPRSWRLDVETLAIRGSHLSLTRNRCRDVDEADQPVTAEILAVMEVNEDGLVCNAVSFDPDAVSEAFAELTARWIASGEVAHPNVIEASQRHLEILNRHDWEAFTALSAGATHVNHRELSRPGTDTVVDHVSSFQAMATLVPDCRLEPAEILTHSAAGFVSHTILKGTSTDRASVEISLLLLVLVEGECVTHLEAFDPDQRDSALARFEELNAAQ